MTLKQLEEGRLAEDSRLCPRCTRRHPGPRRCCRKPSVASTRGGWETLSQNNLDEAARNSGHVSRKSARSGRSDRTPKAFPQAFGEAQAPRKQSSLPKCQKPVAQGQERSHHRRRDRHGEWAANRNRVAASAWFELELKAQGLSSTVEASRLILGSTSESCNLRVQFLALVCRFWQFREIMANRVLAVHVVPHQNSCAISTSFMISIRL